MVHVIKFEENHFATTYMLMPSEKEALMMIDDFVSDWESFELTSEEDADVWLAPHGEKISLVNIDYYDEFA
jgi:hypothetical protein